MAHSKELRLSIVINNGNLSIQLYVIFELSYLIVVSSTPGFVWPFAHDLEHFLNCAVICKLRKRIPKNL